MKLLSWAPFQKPAMRDIYAHLNASEKRTALIRSTLFALWLAVTFAVLLVDNLNWPVPASVSGNQVANTFFLVIGVIGMFGFQRTQLQFLSKTDWAKEKGYTAKDL